MFSYGKSIIKNPYRPVKKLRNRKSYTRAGWTIFENILKQLRDNGWTYNEIARQYGTSNGAIHNLCNKWGIVKRKKKKGGEHD